MKKPKARNWYERHRTYTIIQGVSRTTQSHKDETDVNNIVKRFQRTGELPPNPRGLEGQYVDVTGLQEELTNAYNKATQTTEDYHQLLAEQQQQQQQTEESDPSPPPEQEKPQQSEPEGVDKGA